MPLEYDELKLGCNAKLPASDLVDALSLSSIGSLFPNSSRMNEYSQTIDTIYSFGGKIEDFVEISLSHCANDLICNGILPEYSSYSIGLGINLSKEEISKLLNEIIKCHRKYGVQILNAHTYQGEHTHLTLTLTGKFADQQKKNTEFMLIQTKPLLGMNAFIEGVQVGTNSRSDTLLTNHWSIANLISQYGHSATTDISGFGFLGHLAATAFAHSLNIQVDEAAVLIDPVGLNHFELRGPSCSAQKNIGYFDSYVDISPNRSSRNIYCFYEGETNGPIIIFVSANDVDVVSTKLNDLKCSFSVIGTAIASDRPLLSMR